jgi:hypothetical protein
MWFPINMATAVVEMKPLAAWSVFSSFIDWAANPPSSVKGDPFDCLAAFTHAYRVSSAAALSPLVRPASQSSLPANVCHFSARKAVEAGIVASMS